MQCAVLLALLGTSVSAEETRIVLRVKGVDSKFIGSGVGGIRAVVEDVETGEILDQGWITGGTGDTKRLMETPLQRGQPLADDNTAGYSGRLELAEPRLLRFKIFGPYGQRQSLQEASVTSWVVPGKHITGDGIVIHLPGFIVRARTAAPEKGQAKLEAEVTMMCGCPISKGGLWDADKYEVKALLKRDGKPAGEYPLAFTGEVNHFAAQIPAADKGDYEAVIYAYDPRTGNTGVDRVAFTVR
ncbi:uncharacterized protein sS8_1209 [Methylocaldum marinum]|uniref:Uncharacterized protein n=1 Tax=Methylocaldum marinum TaxID=1432792 RepID=A0A250KQC2_9GAMM|nr:uncharacterized protein sS8_1209 [Methylocaldum marinum]